MIGQTIGKYRLMDRIGRGGMGTVYRATDDMLDRDVAIKVLNAELHDPEVAKRFRAEAVTVARLSHPGIATVYELFEHEGQWLMVMEYVRGLTLETLIDKTGVLSAERAAELCLHTLAALSHAHNLGVVHRDLKPANLMLTEAGVVKVMDFGIARVRGSEHLTGAGYMMGTPAYMAPEQVLGRDIDARVDLYAMGVVLYRLVTGALPFKGDSPFALAQSQVNDPPTPVGQLRADLPPWVDEVITRALAKDPQERYQSAASFHEALARSISGREPTPVYDPSARTEMMVTPPFPMRTATVRPITSSMPAPRGGDTAPMATAAVRAAAAAKRAVALSFSRTDRLVMAGAAVVIALTLGTWWIWNRRVTPADVASNAPAAVEPAPLPVSPPPPPTTAAGTGAPAASSSTLGAVAVPPAAQSVAPPPVDRGATGRSANTNAGTAARSTPAAPAGRGRAASEGHTFQDLIYLTVTGANATEHKAILSLGVGQVNVTPAEGGKALQSLPLTGIKKATFIKANDPQFDPKFAAPRTKISYPNLRVKNWLVLQTQAAFMIIRLDNAADRILEAFESSGVKIARATPPK